MKNIIELQNVVLDFDNLQSSDFKDGIRLKVYSDTHDLFVQNERLEEMDGTIFGIWVECGQKTIMVDVGINELELFAKSILSHVEIIRKHYGTQIAVQTDMGYDV